MSRAGDITLGREGRTAAAAALSRDTGQLKRAAFLLTAGAVLFLLGFVPMWLSARERSEQRDAARRELRIARLENSLAFAAVSARRGQYELARRAASDFFTALRQEMDSAGESALTPDGRPAVRGLLERRDETITLLARNDPASAERLSDLYVAYLSVTGRMRQQDQNTAPEKVLIIPSS
jgi:hypothetical protein